MGLLQRFERRLEDLVGGAFARLFKGQVEPVEIAKALQREADENRAVMGGGRVLVPNRYVVELGPSDHERLAPWETQLTRTLAEMVQEFVDDEGWSAYGDITVSFALDKALRTGMFRVGSDVDMDASPRQRPRDSLSAPLPNASRHSASPGGYSEPYREPARDPYGEPAQEPYGEPARDPYRDPAREPQREHRYRDSDGHGLPVPGLPVPGLPVPGAPIAGAMPGVPGVPVPGAPGVPVPGVPVPGVNLPHHDRPAADEPPYREEPAAYRDESAYRNEPPAYDQPAYDQPIYNQPYSEPHSDPYGQPEADRTRFDAPSYDQPQLYDPPPRAQPVLIIDGTDRRIPVRSGSTVIGRGQEADLRLADTGVSRRHAVVRFDGTTAVIEDLNSTNGTVVNGQRIRTWRLQSEDAIRVGHTVVVFRQESW